MKKRKRNNSIIGWRVDIEEEQVIIDKVEKIGDRNYIKRKYITIFGREFKVFEWIYISSMKIKDDKPIVGF